MKPWWKSWTVWCNVAIVASTWLLNHQGVMKAAGLDADMQGVVIAVANLILRFRTMQAIS